jgi:hypothetical protein
MRLRIAGVFAKCGACQGEDFYPAFPLTPDRRDVMICAGCESQAVFAELVRKSRPADELAQTNWTTTEIPTSTTQSRRNRTPSAD